jgi:uncharacterized membrane protein YkoI
MIDAPPIRGGGAGLLVPVLVGLILVLAPPAPVRADEDQDKATRLKEAGDILSLEEIVEKARGEIPGRILEVELDEEGSAIRYELELLDAAGVVHELTYDARTGRRVKKERDD